ncbi:MAG TPA: EVE domain-containing protein [Nitrososphaera sp.]|nr:EVE domain-containing protein [Nitrososphaera sp.]
MAYWLFKQEPSSYSYSQLESDGRTVWDGVSNNLALKHLRSVRKGDKAFFYHTGDEKQAVGIMEITSDPRPDTKDKSLVIVDVKPAGRLAKPVTLAAIKGDPEFAGWELVRISRLSVMPVPPKLWDRIVKMGR